MVDPLHPLSGMPVVQNRTCASCTHGVIGPSAAGFTCAITDVTSIDPLAPMYRGCSGHAYVRPS